MESGANLFDRWTSMAEDLGYSRQRVHHWRTQRQIPAGREQRRALRVARELGIDVAAEDIIAPFPEDLVGA